MISQSTSLYTPFADGRTVHDIVEHSPALVNERWCRNLLRQVLQSLEQQYASGAPHRRIAPDTLVMLNNGEALLLPASEDADAGSPASASSEASLAADLHALALVVHYAITAESPPDGPIGPRLYDDYSDTLTNGIDRCLGPNLRLRPKSIAEMRLLLELNGEADAAPVSPQATGTSVSNVPDTSAAPATAMVAPLDAAADAALPPTALEDAPPVRSTPVRQAEDETVRFAAPPAPAEAPWVAASTPETAQAAPAAPAAPIPPSAHLHTVPVHAPRSKDKRTQPARAASPGRIQRWAMLAGAAVVALAAGSALFAYLQGGTRAPSPQALSDGAGKGDTAPAPSSAAPERSLAPPPADAPADALATVAEGAAAPAQPSGVPPEALPPAAPGGLPTAARADAVVNGTTYKLMIKPWGTVYVNGVDRGVSPPVKRLTLGPGTHTIRIVNPNFPEHVRTITAGTEEGATIAYDFTAQAE